MRGVLVVLVALAAVFVGFDHTVVAGPPAADATASLDRAAKESAGGVRLVRVGLFRLPVHVTGPPGDPSRVMVVERDGRIRVVKDGNVQGRPFLDIRRRVSSSHEQGLLSMAFAPDYAESGLFYVYFTDRAGDQRVVEFRRRGPDQAELRSGRLVLRMPDDHQYHNGGQLAFGPDGMLYIGTGDGGGVGDPRGNAQDLGSLLGKILRIDPRARRRRAYSIPSGNPFRTRRGARDEIYAYGLRNPWRFSFDRETGDLAIGDVGQDRWEEINFMPRGRGRGANFGWRPFEGSARFVPGEAAPGHVEPVIAMSHQRGNCAVVGGFVVRDRTVPLRGRYVFGDLCRRRVFSAKLTANGARQQRRTSLRVTALTSFGEDALGRVYTASFNGAVHRIVARDESPNPSQGA
jgi:glucose/arabinose dehydrogenase